MRRWAFAFVAVAAVIVASLATSGDPPAPTRAAAPRDPVLVYRPGRPPVAGVTLAGRVVDEADRPVEGATITLDPGGLHATSDADGTFELAVVPGRYTVTAHAGERYASRIPVAVAASSETVVLRLVPGATIVVTVLADDHPLAGADVRLDEIDSATTDPDGIARFAARPPEWLLVQASAPGFALESSRVEIEPGGGLVEQTLRLRRGAAVAGVVVDERNTPIANATLDVVRLDDAQSAPATSDANGRWRVDAVAAGRYHISAKAKGLGPTVATPIVLDGKTPRDGIVVHVARGGTLAGVVVDASGAAQPGIQIELQQSARVDRFSTTSDASGRYEIAGLPEGVYLVLRDVGDVRPADHEVMVHDGARTELRIVIDDDHVSGTVVDAAGAPIEGAWVTGDYEQSRSITDAAGRFSLVLSKGRAHDIVVRRRLTDARPREPDAHVEGSTRSLRLVLPAAGTLTGRVVLDGKPLTSYVLLVVDGDAIGSAIGRTIRGNDGRFARSDVRAGTWHVAVAATGCDIARSADVVVEPGKTFDVGDITMHRGVRIAGRVVDAHGAGVAGARVTIGDRTQGIESIVEGAATTTTDGSGAYAFDAISRAGVYARHIRASHPTFGIAAERELTTDGVPIDFVLEPTGGIDGVVDGFRGDQTYLSAHSETARHTSGSVEVNRAGEFQIDDLVPGTYTIEQQNFGASLRIRTLTATVVAGQRTRVHAMIDPDVVTLIAHVEAAACMRAVAVSQEAGEVPCSGEPKTLAFVRPGDYRACDDKQRCMTFTVAAAPATQEITIRLPP